MPVSLEAMMDLEKSSFGNHHNNNWFRQESLMDTKTTGWKFNEDPIYSFKVFPPQYLLIMKGERVTLEWEAWQTLS